MKTTSTQKHDAWTQHIEQWHSSGKPQAEYCREHHLKLHQFTYWRSKQKSYKKHEVPPSDSSAAFVPVNIAPQQPHGLVLCLPNGCRIEGVTPASMEMVSQLLGLLK